MSRFDCMYLKLCIHPIDWNLVDLCTNETKRYLIFNSIPSQFYLFALIITQIHLKLLSELHVCKSLFECACGLLNAIRNTLTFTNNLVISIYTYNTY